MKFPKLSLGRPRTTSPNLGRKESEKDEGKIKRKALITRVGILMGICVLVGFVCPAVINVYLKFAQESQFTSGTCHINVGVRTNCFPDAIGNDSFTEDECLARGCCYQPLDLEFNAPLCHRKLPSVLTMNVSSEVPKADGSLFKSFPELSVVWPPLNQTESSDQDLRYSFRRISEGHVAVRLYDNSINNEEDDLGDDSDLEQEGVYFQLMDDVYPKDFRLSLKMWEKTNNAVNRTLLNLSHGSVILTIDYSEVTLTLESIMVYGLGGHDLSFNLTSIDDATRFNKILLYNRKGKQKSVPIFYNYNPIHDQYAGYFIDVGGSPLEIEVMPGIFEGTKQLPLVVFRRMGGSSITIHTFLGPDPKSISAQLAAYFGRSGRTPPLWMLGHHICRKCEDEEIAFSKDYQLIKNLGISYDSDCVGAGLLQTAFTVNKDYSEALHTIVETLRTNGTKFLMFQPPHSLDTGDDVFVKVGNGSMNLVSKFSNSNSGDSEPQDVVLPDFSNPATSQWYKDQMTPLMNSFNPDGILLIKNNPSVDLESAEVCDLEGYPFVPMTRHGNQTTETIGVDTLCPDSKYMASDDVHLHNSYPNKHAVAAMAVDNVNVFTSYLSASLDRSVMVSGTDFNCTWDGMKSSLRESIQMGISGFSMISMGVCAGSDQVDEVDDELILRWYQLAGFMPALHSNNIHDLLADNFNIKWIKRAMTKRNQLMPYIRTQLEYYLNEGHSLIRPLFYEFPKDIYANAGKSIWSQFMLGEALIVIPVLDPDAKKVKAYLPRGQRNHLSWYETYSGNRILASTTSPMTEIEVSSFQIPTYLKCGTIVPMLVSIEV